MSKSNTINRPNKNATSWDWDLGFNLDNVLGKDAAGKCLYDAKVASIFKMLSRQDFANQMKSYLCGRQHNGSTIKINSCPPPRQVDICDFTTTSDWMDCDEPFHTLGKTHRDFCILKTQGDKTFFGTLAEVLLVADTYITKRNVIHRLLSIALDSTFFGKGPTRLR